MLADSRQVPVINNVISETPTRKLSDSDLVSMRTKLQDENGREASSLLLQGQSSHSNLHYSWRTAG